ncbi:TPA: hypothetical protein ACQGWO_006489, partial [Pseudomonas aeruginosa]
MERITLVLKSGMGMQLDAIRPYLRPGMPIAIGRAGAVIALAFLVAGQPLLNDDHMMRSRRG